MPAFRFVAQVKEEKRNCCSWLSMLLLSCIPKKKNRVGSSSL